MNKEKSSVYWNWVNGMVLQIKLCENEMREAFSHNRPFYMAGRPVLACFGFKVKEDALDFAKDVFCNAGYFPCDYNFDIVEWDAKTSRFIVGILPKNIVLALDVVLLRIQSQFRRSEL